MEPFLNRLGDSLEPSWKSSWPSWDSLGKPDVPEYLQKTHLFEIASFRYHSSPGPLLEAVLVPFRLFWTPKWGPKIEKMGSKNGTSF